MVAFANRAGLSRVGRGLPAGRRVVLPNSRTGGRRGSGPPDRQPGRARVGAGRAEPRAPSDPAGGPTTRQLSRRLSHCRDAPGTWFVHSHPRSLKRRLAQLDRMETRLQHSAPRHSARSNEVRPQTWDTAYAAGSSVDRSLRSRSNRTFAPEQNWIFTPIRLRHRLPMVRATRSRNDQSPHTSRKSRPRR